jgi:hypothetical protein
MKMRTYLTGAELCRALNIPQSRLTTALDAGIVAADGRAGGNPNSAIIFADDRLEAIRSAIASTTPAPAPAPAPAPEPLRDIAEVLTKAAALHRAKGEVK